MKKTNIFKAIITILIITLFGHPVFADLNAPETRYYTNKELAKTSTTNIELQGSMFHIAKLKYWLNSIATVPIGKETLLAIFKTGHLLRIISTPDARFSAGRTLAPMTEKIINGTGDNVEIWFDASMTEAGSHLVFNTNRKPVEYTAVQNLFHELVHAKHKMLGTWLYFDSEGQAIREENIFRLQQSQLAGTKPTERTYKTGRLRDTVAQLGDTNCSITYQIRINPPIAITQPCQ